MQVSDGSRSGQKLWFNDGGVKKAFKALRLSDDRRQRGVAVEGALTQQEKQVRQGGKEMACFHGLRKWLICRV